MKRRHELDARSRGYWLNPDPDFLAPLLEGLRVNEERYGYPSCPCRFSSGVFEVDRDIICPCDYRDPDVQEFGTCYCCLYVDEASFERGAADPIPERRPPEMQMRGLLAAGGEDSQESPSEVSSVETGRTLRYCRVCGYVVFREEPPYVCPICRAKREMFAEIDTGLGVRST
ncbi:MAG: ferredoxin:glutaredoxin reductase [Candidatus Bathyarchaeota archaeon]|nr:ferredoxin:glutaredoxin reductase [Candidatus Bathyarchaeota archaeon]